MTHLEGRIAVVTGAGRGIGRAIALALASRGVRLALVSRGRQELEAVAAQVRAAGGEAQVFPADLAAVDGLGTLASGIREVMGPPQILVNNAGKAESAPIGRIRDDDWDATMTLNLVAPFVLCRHFLPDMQRSGWGRIVNVASTAALKGYPYTAAYTASKHGLLGLTRALSREWVGRGITVNAVCPGYVDTAIAADAAQNIARKTGVDLDAARLLLTAENPLGRLVRPEEVAAAVLSFLGPESDCLSGQALAVAAGAIEG